MLISKGGSKPAHSDLLQAIPQPGPERMTYEEKVKLVTPFIYVRSSIRSAPRFPARLETDAGLT